jgi:hypothetical protein
MKRRVYIKLIGDSFFVRYADRAYRGRHCAAVFYALDTTHERVVAWVNNNHKLELVAEEKP